MIATIELEDIEIYAYHGCYEEEQRVGNKFIVNVSLDVECAAAAQSDDIVDALNYLEVYDIVKEEMAVKAHLLENVTNRIAGAIQQRFKNLGLVGGIVKVSKIAPPVGGVMRSVSVAMNIGYANDK